MHWTKTLYHDGSPALRQLDTAGEHRLTLTLRVARNAPPLDAYLWTSPDGEQEMTRMEEVDGGPCHRLFRITLQPSRLPFDYRFLVMDAADAWWFSENGAERIVPPDSRNFRVYAPGTFPDWVPDSVFYQIFPDRFHNGDPTLSVKDGEYEYRGRRPRLRDWEDTEPDGTNNSGMDFYGGDLPGIREKLPWLEELGVNALYLTPIFHAPSNHKYDTQDYDTVDPHFGTAADLAALTARLRASGMRLILDGVFNHVGVAHRWFNREGYYQGAGAYQSLASPYADFFIFQRFPDDYACWKGVESLPKLDYRSRKLREAVYGTPESPAVKWLNPPWSVDGWRLDVANMLGRHGGDQLQEEVYPELRAAVRAGRPDAYLLGEHFFDGSALVNERMLDAIMNYQGFTFPLWKWLLGNDSFLAGWERIRYPVRFTAQDMAAQMRRFRCALGYDRMLLAFNQLNSHDTPRLATLLGDAVLYRLALVLLFAYPGTPCIYYGDEIGLGGGPDPDNRRPMCWDPARQDHERLALVKALVRLRRASPALARGGFVELLAGEECFAFARIFNEETMVCVVRRAETPGETALPVSRLGGATRYRDVLGGESHPVRQGRLVLNLPPTAGLILRAE